MTKGKREKFRITITDQSHPVQRATMPPDAVLGWGVRVDVLNREGKYRFAEGSWARTHDQAERIAQEYYRQYATMEACGWH